MKKTVVSVMLIVVLASGFCAQAICTTEDLIEFCEGFNVLTIVNENGSASMRINCNDALEHHILVYTDDIKSDQAEMVIYQSGWDKLLGTAMLGNDNGEEIIEDVVIRIYEMEAVNKAYEEGSISKNYYDEMMFRYRIVSY